MSPFVTGQLVSLENILFPLFRLCAKLSHNDLAAAELWRSCSFAVYFIYILGPLPDNYQLTDLFILVFCIL